MNELTKKVLYVIGVAALIQNGADATFLPNGSQGSSEKYYSIYSTHIGEYNTQDSRTLKIGIAREGDFLTITTNENDTIYQGSTIQLPNGEIIDATTPPLMINP